MEIFHHFLIFYVRFIGSCLLLWLWLFLIQNVGQEKVGRSNSANLLLINKQHFLFILMKK